MKKTTEQLLTEFIQSLPPDQGERLAFKIILAGSQALTRLGHKCFINVVKKGN